MKLKSRRSKVLLFVVLFSIFSAVFLQFFQDVEAMQDDSSLEVTLHGRLISNSQEVQSEYLGTGLYTYYETPEMDDAEFSHDLTRFDINDLQSYSMSEYEQDEVLFLNEINATQGDHQIQYNNSISEYDVSSELETRIELNLTHEFEVFDTNDYVGTFSFTDDAIGSNPNGWTVYEDGGTVNVIESVDGHDKIVELDDTSGADDIELRDTFSGRTEGTIEFYYRQDTASKLSSIIIGDLILGTGGCIQITFAQDGYIKYYGTDYTTITTYSADTWYHMRIDFDVNDDWHLWINGVSQDGGVGYSFRDNPSSLDKIRFISEGSHANYKMYVDAVGYSWDSEYDIGNNEIEIGEYRELSFTRVNITNFNYSILGITYAENITLILASSNETEITPNHYLGWHLYYFDSSMLQQNPTTDLTILEQNITICLNISLDFFNNFSLSTNISVSSNQFKVPSEVDFSLNGNDVIDETYNSGYSIIYSAFPNTLLFEATDNVIFTFNSTTYFQFTFELNIITRTYLRAEIELVSNHEIIFDKIELPTQLEIKKVYFNNIDLGSDNTISLTNGLEMDTGNEYYLEVILEDVIHERLVYVDDDTFATIYYERFTTLTSEMMYGTYPSAYNSTFSVNEEVAMYNEFPNEFKVEDWSSWILDYDNFYSNSTFSGTDLDSYLAGYNNSITPSQPGDFNEIHGVSDYSGDLETIDGSYSTFNSTKSGYFNATHDFTEETEEGYYYGTYDFNQTMQEGYYYGRPDNFNDESVGTSGTDIEWVDYADQDGGTLSIISSYHGHEKVLEFNDTNEDSVVASHGLGGYDNDEAHEFWIATNDASKGTTLLFCEDGTTILNVYISAGNLYYVDSLGANQVIQAILNDNWYHLRVDWDSDNTFDLYVNGTKKVDDQSTRNSMTNGINAIYINTASVHQDYAFYLDAYGELSDSDYSAGYNLNPYDITGIWDTTLDALYCAHDSYIKINSSIDGHSDVLELYDGTGSLDDSRDVVGFERNFDAQSSGIVELWFRGDDLTKLTNIILYYLGSIGVQVSIESNTLKYYYSGSTHDATGGALNDDEWYHFRISFDCSTDTYDFYLNGSLLDSDIPFRNNQDDLNLFYFRTKPADSDYSYYLDALGFSWDTSSHYGLGYEIGYNINPYNIENLLLNTFDYISCGHDSWINITDEIDGHHDVLELYDGTGTMDDGKDDVGAYIDFSAQTSGTIEFWIRSNDVTDSITFTLRDSTLVKIQVAQFNDKWQYYDGASWNDFTSGGTSDDTWYHVRIDFDCGTDTLDFYLDGLLLDADIAFRNAATSLNRLYFQTGTGESIYTYYLDGLGFSWDSNYDVGDNENSCKIEFNVDVDLSQVYNLNASSEDAVDFTHLYYSFQTDIYQLYNLSMYNVKTAQFDLINSSYNNETFFDNLETFNFNNYINGSGHLLLKFVGYNFSTEYQLFLEKLVIEFNWTKQGPNTFASISKDIDYSFLNYYDAYSNYQKLYNISINVLYRFTNHTSYDENATFTVESNEYSLTTDGTWNALSHDFEFDSASENDFSVIFNISNGLLELSELNYSITFICLDTSSKTRLYQSFELDPSFSLTDYQKDDFEIILNFTHSLSASAFDSFDYSHSSVLIFNISIKSEEGWSNITYNYNSSASRNFELNIREYLDNNSLEQFLDFKLYLWVSGNATQFTMDDLYLYSMYERLQLTEAPRTDETSCEFVDYLVADRDFEYWYFYNDLEINDVDMKNIRSSEYTDEFDEETDRYYFEDTAQENDVYESYLDYDPEYDIEYEIESDGATADLRIEYSADIAVKNCTLVLDLSDEEIYMENWTYNADQSSRTFILEIPRVNFTTSTRVLRLEGVSEFPNAHFSGFQCQELVMIDGSPHTYEYRGYIEYPRYSQAFYLQDIEDDWELDGVHYSTRTMTIKQSNGYFECPGYDSSITTSYLKFTADPVDSLTIYDLTDESRLRIEIKLNLPVANASVMFALPSEYRYEIRTTLKSLTKIPDVLGYDYYLFFYDGLEEGANNIYVEYRIHTIEDDSMLYLLIVILSIGFVGLYYYRKKKLERMETKGMTPEQKKKYLEKKKKNKPESYLSKTWKSFKKQVKNLRPESKYIKRARKLKKPRVLH